MTDRDLPDLLDRLAERHPVGPPPTSNMVAAASRARRRSISLIALGASAAVASVAVAGVVLPRMSDGPAPHPAVPVTSGPTVDDFRLVGAGHVGILVPDTWVTNALDCDQPTADTVVVNGAMADGASRLCAVTVTPDPETVQLLEGDLAPQLPPGRHVLVAGKASQRKGAICELSDPAHCFGEVYFPDDDVSFLAESSTSAGVDAILDRIVALEPDQVPVPARSYLAGSRKSGPATSAQDYAARLRELGLVPRLVAEPHPGWPLDYIVSVEPETGTILKSGDIVTVTYVPPAASPADLVRVGANSAGSSTSAPHPHLTDEQIRAGATIHLVVGDRIWVYAEGRRATDLTVVLAGQALTPIAGHAGPDQGRTWRAVESGTTEITLSVVVDGRSYEIGTVRVVVD